MTFCFRSPIVLTGGLCLVFAISGPVQAKMSLVEHAISYLDVCLETTDYVYEQKDSAERGGSRFISMSVLSSRLETDCLSAPLGYCEADGQVDPTCLEAIRADINDRATEMFKSLPEEIQADGFAPRNYARRLEAVRQGPTKADDCQVPDTYPEIYCEALGSTMHLYSVRVLNRMVQRNSSVDGEN